MFRELSGTVAAFLGWKAEGFILTLPLTLESQGKSLLSNLSFPLLSLSYFLYWKISDVFFCICQKDTTNPHITLASPVDNFVIFVPFLYISSIYICIYVCLQLFFSTSWKNDIICLHMLACITQKHSTTTYLICQDI